MKVFIFSLVCITLLGCSKPTSQNNPATIAQRIAVSNVIEARMDAIRVNSTLTRDGRYVGLNQRGFLDDLQRIDTKNCPQDFKIAWLDYVAANQAELDRRGKALLGLIAMPVTGGASIGLAVDSAKKGDQRISPWTAVEKQALLIGVDIPPDPPN